MTGLWDWSLEAWTKPGVGDAAIELQDGYSQNTCLLLWAAWMSVRGLRLDADVLEAACDIARAWEETTVAPLRVVRRTLKKPVPDMEDGPREAIRERVKAVELDAEHALLDELEALAAEAKGPGQPMETALAAASRAWGGVTPRAHLNSFAARLSA